MKVLKCFGELVDDELDMNVLNDVLADDVMQISLHILKDQIHISIILGRNRLV